MAGDELFKRYLEIGASVLGMSRERAERIVADLVASGEVAKGQASKAADWLVERGRSGTDELAELVRREIRQQVTALGLATKDDVERLQAQLDEVRASTAVPPQEPAGATKPVKAAKAAKSAKAAKPTQLASGREKPAAGISRAGSVRKSPRGPGSSEPGATPPAGGAGPSKG